MRNLASVQRIKTTTPIPGKDRIQVARILGWDCVVSTDFKPGDLCIYIEIDSILPEKPEFEFMRKHNFRVRTIKFGGQISQGLAIPLNTIEGVFKEGDDVTDILHIIKWEEPEIEETKTKNTKKKHKVTKVDIAWPTWIKKTDETRIQNFDFDALIAGKQFQITEKIDGCSATYAIKKKLFGWKYIVASRNRVLPEDDISHYMQISDKLNIKQKLIKIAKDYKVKEVVLQGEIIGPKIQGNKYQIHQLEFYAFNLIFNGKRLDTVSMGKIMGAHQIMHVPILNIDRQFNSIEEILEYANNRTALRDDIFIWREGIVCRTEDISFKAISNTFLLEHKI